MSKEFWDRNAISWDSAIQSQHLESRRSTNPAIVQEILRHSPRSVLDLGCGEGWLASQILPLDIEYTGLDCSPKLVGLAARKYSKGNFETASYEEIASGQWKSTKQYDLTIFNFSLFEKDLHAILQKVRLLTKPRGTILIQTLHPSFALMPYEDGWRVENFQTFPVAFDGTIDWYGRTLSSWSQLFSDCELAIQSIVEPLSAETKLPLSIIFALKSIAPSDLPK